MHGFVSAAKTNSLCAQACVRFCVRGRTQYSRWGCQPATPFLLQHVHALGLCVCRAVLCVYAYIHVGKRDTHKKQEIYIRSKGWFLGCWARRCCMGGVCFFLPLVFDTRRRCMAEQVQVLYSIYVRNVPWWSCLCKDVCVCAYSPTLRTRTRKNAKDLSTFGGTPKTTQIFVSISFLSLGWFVFFAYRPTTCHIPSHQQHLSRKWIYSSIYTINLARLWQQRQHNSISAPLILHERRHQAETEEPN